MTTLTCPKCRHGIPDEALDVGQCPSCGFPLDGPVVLATPGSRSGVLRLLVAVGLIVLLAGGGFAGYQFLTGTNAGPDKERVDRGREPDAPALFLAPFPHEPKRPASVSVPDPTPAPGGPKAGPVDKGQPPVPPVTPAPPVEPVKKGPRPVGVRVPVNPKVEPRRHFDQPDDIAAVPDLNSNDHVVLTGRIRTLTLGGVNGRGSVDASGLVAEEVIITGDLNGEATVTVNAPNGKVTIGGYVGGTSKLTVHAPGGAVVLANSGRFTGGSTVAITAKRLDALGVIGGGTKVHVTFTSGGGMKFTRAEEGATVTYQKGAAGDPAPVIEPGELHGGAKVLPQ